MLALSTDRGKLTMDDSAQCPRACVWVITREDRRKPGASLYTLMRLSLSLARPRHVIHHIHELDFYSQMSSYDVAVIICWAQPHRAEVGAVKEIARVEPME